MQPDEKFLISLPPSLQFFMYFSFFAKALLTGLILLGYIFLSLLFSKQSFGVTPIGSYPDEYYQNIDQPIGFNHKVHVQDNQISCESCHSQARVSDSAGVPSVRSCIGCHVLVKGTTEEQQKEIAKISEYWKASQPIPWNKIHDLPDFVRFSHKAHLNVGFDCTDCHGDVSKVVMPIPQPYEDELPLSMGWCVSCHRTDWPLDAKGKIAAPVRATRGGDIVGEPHPAVSTLNGPMDCLVCHK